MIFTKIMEIFSIMDVVNIVSIILNLIISGISLKYTIDTLKKTQSIDDTIKNVKNETAEDIDFNTNKQLILSKLEASRQTLLNKTSNPKSLNDLIVVLSTIENRAKKHWEYDNYIKIAEVKKQVRNWSESPNLEITIRSDEAKISSIANDLAEVESITGRGI